MGFGIHSQTLYTEKVGLFVDLNFFFPQKMTLKVSQGASSYSDVLTREDFDSLWGMSFLAGPSFAVSRGEGHIFTISPGIHYNLVSMKGDGGVSAVYMFGTGVNFQNNMKINERVYVDIGLELTYDFICKVITSGDTNSDVSHDFTCVPKIGLGFFL
ncbi:MAG: hypothetical protein E7061_11335 [Treponema sp.]|nr:hypothetical protein [Treponema sp.]